MIARQYRIPAAVFALIAAAMLGAVSPARAHHSASAFDATQTISVEGVVTRYEWANPHVYIWLEARGANGKTVEWQIEGQPPAVLRRIGWSQNTLDLGDTIQATGNPARNEQRKSLLLVSMKRAAATLYDGPALIGALTTSVAAPAAADSLAGTWVTLLDMDAMQSYLNPARRVPLTEAGAAAQAAFDEATMSPALRCVPTTAPSFMYAPDVKRITLEKGLIRIAGEFDDAERVIHLVDDGYGASAEALTAPSASLQGHSVGRWDGATLVIETTDFTPHGTGVGFTLPSSSQKRLVERLTLDADGTGLAYAFELTDAEMLTAPITGGTRWIYRPDLEFAPVACNPENATRFLG